MDIWLRGAARYALVAFTVLFALFVLSQVAQLAALAGAVHPAFGMAVAAVLLAALAALVLVPAAAYLRLQPPLAPPAALSGPEHDAFVKRYLEACRRNPLLADRRLETEEDLAAAVKALEAEAEKVVTQTASQVFLGTAVSRYGSLDTLIVAATQLAMIWRIAHVFQRRPSFRHMTYLYANVLGTAAAASQVEKLDLAQHLQPVLTSLLGQSVSSVPGVSAPAGFVTNSLFQGSVNAFLTLRVGMVAIEYSRATVRPERSAVWQTAVAKAAKLMARTVTSGTTRVTRAFAVAAGRSVMGAATSVVSAVGEGGRQVGTAVSRGADAVAAAAGQVGDRVRGLGRRRRGSEDRHDSDEADDERAPGLWREAGEGP